ncbi:HAD family hydrolase, partial [Streptomyces carpinensis]
KRLELTGEGEPLDGLRALCAVAWTAGGESACELDGGKALARLGL